MPVHSLLTVAYLWHCACLLLNTTTTTAVVLLQPLYKTTCLYC